MHGNESFENEQLRRAYAAGYEAGFADGRESLPRKGWTKPHCGDDCPPGSIIKLLVKTIFGWKGMARVIYADDNSVHAQRLDHDPEDYDGGIDACLHEVMVRKAAGARG